MTSTSTRTGRAATETVSGGARSAGSQAMRAAGRQLLATAGNQVLKAAVDRAVGKVDDVAGRLDSVASGERRKPSRPPTSRKPAQRPAPEDDRQSGNPVRVKVGAAFNLVLQQAMRLLQLIQRLAQQLLAALSRLFHRGKDTASKSAETESAEETESPSVIERAAPRKQGDKPKRAVDSSPAERTRPAAGNSARAPQEPRRQGPRPTARQAVSGSPTGRRRPAGSGSE